MFTVIIAEKGGEQRRLDFDKGEVTIGRVQGNDIILPKGNVSKRHSRIVFKDGKFIVVDLKSTNGTYVNGRKISSPLVIKQTDKVYIGDFIITVEEQGESDLSEEAAPVAPAEVPVPVPSRKVAPPPLAKPPIPDDDADGVDIEPELEEVRAHAASQAERVPPQRFARPSGPLPSVAPSIEAASSVRTTSPAPSPQVMPVAPLRAPSFSPRDRLAPPVETVPPPSPPPAVRPDMPRKPLGSPAAAARREPGRQTLLGAGLPSAAAVMPVVPVSVSAPATQPAARTPTTQPASRTTTNTPGRDWPRELQRDICDRLGEHLDVRQIPPESLSDDALWRRAESAISDLLEQLGTEGVLPEGIDQDALIKDSLNETLGLGVLEDLLVDDEITEIIVTRFDQLLVERGGEVIPIDRGFSSEASLQLIVERIVTMSGRLWKDSAPFLDVRLRDGVRLIAVLPPLSPQGPSLRLRKPRRTVLSLDDLSRDGTLSPHMADFLVTCIATHRNIVVCGEGGAGKTTLLGALIGAVPPTEQIVLVEDVAELNVPREHVVLLEAHALGGEPSAGVEALRAGIRLGGDRLVVGDVRGAEAYELLAFMGASEGSLVGINASGAMHALARLETLGRLLAGDSASRAVRELVANAVHVIVHVARFADGVRRVTTISEVAGLENDGYAIRDLFHFQVQGRTEDGRIRGRHAGAGLVPRFYEVLEARGVPVDPSVFR